MITAEISERTLSMTRNVISEAFMIPYHELPRVLYHAIILTFVIGGFWLLDSLKDPILAATIGIEFQPLAKFMSVAFTLLVVCVYDFMNSIVSKPTLFYLVSGIYGTSLMIISAILADPETGLKNRVKSEYRIIGWISYFMIESYGSLMATLFWSFTNSIMDLEQAKGAYGLIIAIAQLGAISGATIARQSTNIGISQLYLMGSLSIFSVALLIKIYHLVFRDHRTNALRNKIHLFIPASTSGSTLAVATTDGGIDGNTSSSTTFISSSLQTTFNRLCSGFYEGLSLIIRHRYLMFILGVSCIYEIVLTVLDFEFKVRGSHFTSSTFELFNDNGEGDSNRFADLMGRFGQSTNLFSLFISVFGFSFLVKRLGVRYTLLIFPSLMFVCVILINLVPNLWVIFVLLSLLKGMTYSLCDPVKELLYMPTSDTIKFRAKAWIDVFGSRLAKGIGSSITHFSHGDLHRLRVSSEIPVIVLCLLYLAIASKVGLLFEDLVAKHLVVGEEASSRSPNITYDMEGYYPIINGLKAGDVGYEGYDLKLFDGVFIDDNITKGVKKVDDDNS